MKCLSPVRILPKREKGMGIHGPARSLLNGHIIRPPQENPADKNEQNKQRSEKMNTHHEKLDVNKVIGRNIKVERKRRGVARDDLAVLLGVSTSHMGLMERGERGVHALNLAKLSQLFDLPIGEFFDSSKSEGLSISKSLDDKMQANREAIYTLAGGLGESEMAYAVLMIRGLLSMQGIINTADVIIESDAQVSLTAPLNPV